MTDSLVESVATGRIAALGTSLLLGSAIKAVVLLGVVGAVAWWLREASAAMRHLLWSCAIAGLLALPILALVLPGWDVLPSWVEIPPAPDRSLVEASIEPGLPSVGSLPQRAPDGNQAQAVSEVAALPATREPVMPADCVSWQWAALVVWMAGCVGVLVPVLTGMVNLIRFERHAQRLDGGPIDRAARRMARRLGVQRRVPVFLGKHRSMPMLWGILRPRVLIPAAAREWPAERIEAVLAHEFAHLRRHDCSTQMAARLACAMYWYLPPVWWAARRMLAESELACDDLALNSGCRAPDYAEQLLRVAAGGRTDLLLGSAAIAMAGRSRLEVRLRAILDDRRNRLGPTGLSALGCAVLVVSLAFPLALMRGEPLADRPADAAAENPFLAPPIAPRKGLGPAPVRLGYVDNTAKGKRSIAGSGHAVKYRRPTDEKYLVAIEMFASRYGHFTPPAEDFHIYVLDGRQKVIHAQPFPYSQIEWGFPRWYTLTLPAVEVPEAYYVALTFNPHQTKGIYLGWDESAKRSHSYVGRPTAGLQPVNEKIEWMVRSVLAHEIPKRDPFQPQDK